jgi:hypothetical protein
MAGTKEIRNKIRSIKNTQKITAAMEMVAASKMRKAQDRMKAARPFAAKVRTVVSHLAHAHPEYQHTYLLDREVKGIVRMRSNFASRLKRGDGEVLGAAHAQVITVAAGSVGQELELTGQLGDGLGALVQALQDLEPGVGGQHQ